MQLRAITLSFAIVGLFVMSFLLFLSPKEIDTLNEDDFHKVVSFSGEVNRERITGAQHYMYVGNVSVRCSCENEYLDGKNVKIVGFVNEFDGKFYVQVLRISII